MTTSISSEAFEKKKTESKRMNDNTVNKKDHKWKNGQSELMSRCLVIIKS